MGGAVLLTALVAVSLTAVGEAPDRALEVRIDTGIVRGVELRNGVRSFKGIPYAKPPVGDLRWKPPQPVSPWKGVKVCRDYGNRCPQPSPILGHERGPMSEDCLTLNVWTRSHKGAGRPVMVWIHGGGFTTGSGAMKVYDGTQLARNGVVLVTINYRLGPFGFFAHPLLSHESPRGVSGNYGFLDQIAALKWVRRNITGFGGDPNCVTIFGESAGSMSVVLHLVSPLSKGLFHRAIMESGSVFGQFRHLRERAGRFASMESEGEKIAGKLGCANSPDPLAALRKIPAAQLLEASNASQGLFGKGLKFWPVVDGWVFPDNPAKLLENGRTNSVPVIVGSNADEATVFLKQLPVKRVIGYRLLMRMFYGKYSSQVLDLFPARTDADVRDALNQAVTIGVFTTAARRTARCLAAGKSKVWLYHFVRVPPLPVLKPLGAFHSAEIPYVFGNMHLPWGFDETDRKISRSMVRAWTIFARTGNPNGSGLSHWPVYDANTDLCLVFGENIHVVAGFHRQACDLFDAIARNRRDREE